MFWTVEWCSGPTFCQQRRCETPTEKSGRWEVTVRLSPFVYSWTRVQTSLIGLNVIVTCWAVTCTYNMASNMTSATWPWITRMRKRNTFTGIRYLGVEQINHRQVWREMKVSKTEVTSLPPDKPSDCRCVKSPQGSWRLLSWPREVWGSHLCSPSLCTFVYTPRTCLVGGTWGYSRYIFEYFMGLRQTDYWLSGLL